MEIRKVGVVGCGLMGSGIAQVSAMSGHPTMVREVSQDLLDSGLARIERFLGRGVEKEKVSPEEMERTMDNITGTLKLEELAERDIVVEAIVRGPRRQDRSHFRHSTTSATLQPSSPQTPLLSQLRLWRGR